MGIAILLPIHSIPYLILIGLHPPVLDVFNWNRFQRFLALNRNNILNKLFTMTFCRLVCNLIRPFILMGLTINNNNVKQYGIKNYSKSSANDDIIKWVHFPCYWSFVQANQQLLVNSPHEGQRHRVWCSLWSAPEKTIVQTILRWWFEMQSCPLWHHSNALIDITSLVIRQHQFSC